MLIEKVSPKALCFNLLLTVHETKQFLYKSVKVIITLEAEKEIDLGKENHESST